MDLKKHEKVLEGLRKQDSEIVLEGAANNDL